MKFFTLLLSVAFLAAGINAVNGKLANEEATEHDKTSAVPMPVVKPTSAPLMSSTVAPQQVPRVKVSPTKSPNVKPTVKPNNADKKTTTSKPMPSEKPTMEQMAPSEMKATEKSKTMENEMKMKEAMPLAMPDLQAEETKKPLAVTGFITKNGDIYEIEDKTGAGKIQARQAEEDDAQHVCNYGSIVIYSDVPCNQVTNVKVSEVEEKPAVAETAVQQNKPAENTADNKDSEDKEDLVPQRKPSRRPNNKPRRNKNKKAQVQNQKQKPNRNKKRPNKNGQNRPVKNNNNQNKRRRLTQKQLKQQKNRRRLQQQKKQQNNRRQTQAYDDEKREFENQRRRNQQQKRRNHRRQPAQYYESDYDY